MRSLKDPSKKNRKFIIPAVVLIIAAALAGGLITYYFVSAGAATGLEIQKPSDSIRLPAGISMNNPYGYTIFRSEAYGMILYSFVKYEEAWKDNVFFKADMAVFPFKRRGAGDDDPSAIKTVLKDIVIDKKILLQSMREREHSRQGESADANEIDYRSFVPDNQTVFELKGKEWNSCSLVKKEETGGTSQIRCWNNIYTMHDGYVITLDYVAVKRPMRDKTKKTEEYIQAQKEIDADIYAMIEGISFDQK